MTRIVCVLLFSCLVAVALAAVPKPPGNKWAVLVAGSKGWSNYRHQAAVSHAYQVVRGKGIPPERIITMMFDDIARNPNNPHPGEIFTDYTHTDHYKGVQIDYRGLEVTVDNFLKVLKGDAHQKSLGKKVLESGPDDDVFLFFSDHGSTNLIAFPQRLLYADSLNDTLTWMHTNGRYKKMLLYIEACESGSMFKDILSESMGIYATTSANPYQSGYACNCDDPDFSTCLGDEYSVAWTADSETRVGQLPVSDFQGEKNILMGGGHRAMDRHPARETHLLQTRRRINKAQTQLERELYESELAHKTKRGELVRESFNHIERALLQGNHVNNEMRRDKRATLQCFRELTETYTEYCYTLQTVPEVAKYLRTFDQLCTNGVHVKKAVNVIESLCT